MSPGEPEDPARHSTQQPRSQSGRRRTLWGIAILAGMVLGAWYYAGNSSTEDGHPNWQHVAAATEASSTSNTALSHVDKSGAASIVAQMEVSSIDVDRETTRRVRSVLQSNAPHDAAQHIRAGQSVPADPAAQQQPPDLVPNSDLARAIEDETTKFFHLDVFDSCDEDGDVVQIVVNGEPFITVPILHEGATISVPLARGANSIALRGIRDGGGGITVSFRTSRGEYFTKRMRVGEEHQFGVVVQ